MSTPTINPWTEERIAELRRLWALDHSGTEIAKIMGGGLTKNSIIGKATRLGLPRRRLPTVPKPKPAPKPISLVRYVKRKSRDTNALYVPLSKIEPRQCHWPMWKDEDNGAPNFPLCGQDCAFDSAYCEHHTSLSRPVAKMRVGIMPSYNPLMPVRKTEKQKSEAA